MDKEPIDMVRSVFGNWEADFVANRREQLFNYACAAIACGCVALALTFIAIFGK